MKNRSTEGSTGSVHARSTRRCWRWVVIVSGLLVAAACSWFAWKQRSSPTSKQSSLRTAAPFAAIIGYSEERTRGAIEAELARLDPLKDEWDTEAFSEQAAAQLKVLGEMICRQDALSVDQPAGLLDVAFSSSPWRPTGLQALLTVPSLVVLRAAAQNAPGDDQGILQSPRALQDALASLRAPLRPDQLAAIRVKFKIFHVEPGALSTQTRAYFQSAAVTAAHSLQQNAVWTCQWKRLEDGSPPRLESIRVSDYEEIATSGEQGSLFADGTALVLGGNPSYREQLSYSLDHWREILDWRFGLDFIGSHGLAVGDVNGDGLEDVFYCETGGLPNRLFVQQPDGTARDASVESGVDYLEPTHSALLVDLDNDADQDLVLASGRFLLFLENDGAGRFERRTIHDSTSVIRSITAVDFDQDGALDVYACGYFPRETPADSVGLGRPMPYHDANNGGRNLLLANRRSWKLEDVTEAVGLEMNNRRFSYAAAWEDFDNDGDLDLYVANDFGRNNLYRNDRGRFVDVAASAGVEDIGAGMSVSWGDYNRDGLIDLHVGNMFSSAGQRITGQRQFKDGVSDGTRASYQRHARGNSLFENAGDGTFRDVSIEAAVTVGRWAWSSNFVDVNSDGWEDLLVANGMVTSPEDAEDL